MNNLIIEDTENGEIAIDIYQKLANDRIIFIHENIDDKIALDICATLMVKNNESSDEKISIFINSEAGDIRSVFMIYDVMQMVEAPIETICIGAAYEEALLLLVAGTPGMRYATPNATICGSHVVHDRIMYSDMTDIKLVKELVANDNKKFIEALSKHVKKPYKQLYSDFSVKKFMSPTQAKKYGIIDGIIKAKK